MKKLLIGTALASFAMAGSAMAGGHSTTVCLITKTDTNPFFVKMREGANAKAEELGMTLKAFAGKVDGDHETQVQAIETCIAVARGEYSLQERDHDAIDRYARPRLAEELANQLRAAARCRHRQ